MSSDYALEDTVYLPFTTRQFSTGAPFALAGTPPIDVYEDATATPITAADTLTVSLNSVVGFNMVAIAATAANGFEAGKSYTAIIGTGGTVDSVSAVGEVIGHFTIEASAALAEIGTAGAGLTDLGGMSTGMQAEVNAEVDTAIETYHLHYLLHTTYNSATPPGVTDALLNELTENDAGETRFTTNALENAPGGTPASALLQSTTILAYTSNTSFTLTAGSADNDAYNNQMIVITDQATGTQKAVGHISDYVGTSRTVTLTTDPGIFTFANGDTVEIWAVTGSSVGLEVDASGRVNIGKVFDVVQTGSDLATDIAAVDLVATNIAADLANSTDGLGALKTDIGTAQADLDTITGTDGVTLATAQALYAPATATALATTDGKVDTIDTVVDGIQTDLDNGTDGLGAIKTDTAAVKLQTDKLAFTVTNQVDANIQSVDDAAISEGGSAPASPYGQT